ncbi:InlB B-repeat-containing protein [Thiocapsa sp. UBA6158]|jgi:hypothetical protein|uniref:InlB B-repeat-containing protein n=1 Tax=Thiocapsa sp. UBA6158 TaxID=1947692 RepID=UPI0025F1B908|nr:choice-of-anchor Q domain-containing protein [Thiocapsa sp. UBA6158]
MTRSPFTLPSLLVSIFVLCTLSAPVNAAVFCVADATGLQAALTAASSNGEDDQIQIVQGTYVGNFVYATTQANALAMQGGWTAGCAGREIDATNTVLDGGQAGTVLVLSAPNVAPHLAVEGLTLRNGLRTSGCGGGIHATLLRTGRVTVTDSLIVANTVTSSSASASGGGICLYGTAILTNNQIQNNTSSAYSSSYGGGAYIDSLVSDGTFRLINNIFHQNSASSSGLGNSHGGGIYIRNSYAQPTYALLSLTNNNFHGNEAAYGGSAHLSLSGNESLYSTAFYNNLFWNNVANGNEGADLWVANDPNGNYLAVPVLFSHNSFDQNEPRGFFSQLPITINLSNLDQVDPLFVDADNGDLHLSAGSPMIDAGDPDTPDLPETDLDDNPRVVNGLVDIGAYEFNDGSDPEGVDYGADCAHAFPLETPATLTGTPDGNSVFDGCGGDADCSDAQLTMDGDRACTATFNAVRQLTVAKAGEGDGTVTSTPAGIYCGGACAANYLLGTSVSLTATPSAGARFDGWSGHADCQDGQITLDADRQCTATFARITEDTQINAAILPYARAIPVGDMATAFASVINSGNLTAIGCSLALPHGLPATFSYQTTNTANALIGTADTPVDIPPGTTQAFVFGITPSQAMAATEIPLVFDCANTSPAPSHAGLNTFILSAAATAPPDLLAIGATPSGDGVVQLASNTGIGFFTTAAVNIGSAGEVTVSADDDGRGLPLNLQVCETNARGDWLVCGNHLDRSVGAGQTLYYTVLAFGNGQPIPFDPANNRLFLRFDANGTTVGATNVAVTAP